MNDVCEMTIHDLNLIKAKISDELAKIYVKYKINLYGNDTFINGEVNLSKGFIKLYYLNNHNFLTTSEERNEEILFVIKKIIPYKLLLISTLIITSKLTRTDKDGISHYNTHLSFRLSETQVGFWRGTQGSDTHVYALQEKQIMDLQPIAGWKLIGFTDAFHPTDMNAKYIVLDRYGHMSDATLCIENDKIVFKHTLKNIPIYWKYMIDLPSTIVKDFAKETNDRIVLKAE